MENRKYEITDITMRFEGRTLYRIRALKDFADVKAGDLGGWVSSRYNLSQEGDCWVYNNAMCMDNSRMFDNSRMYNNAVMCDFSEMHNHSTMCDNAVMYVCSKMYEYSIMHDNSIMYDYSKMYGYSEMHDDTEMHDHSEMHDDSIMHGHSRMYDYSKMYGYSEMHDFSVMYDNSRMYGSSEMYDNGEMFDNSEIHDCGEMCGDSKLKGREKLYGKLVSEVDNFIEINDKEGNMVTGVLRKGKMLFNIDYFEEITKEEFLDIIYNEDGGIEENPHRKEYLKIIDMIELYLLK